MNLGSIYTERKEYDKAIDYYNKALQIQLKSNDIISAALSYASLGSVNNKTGNYQLALDFFIKAMDLYKKTDSKKGLASTYLNIARLYFNLNQYGESISYSTKSLNIATELNTPDLKIRAYENLSEAAEKMGNHSKALAYYKQFKQLNDSVFNTDKTEQIIKLQAQFEGEQKEKENELLRKENTLQTYAIEKQKILRNILYGSILVLIIVSLATYKRVRVRKKMNIELHSKNDVILKQQEELSENLTRLEETNEELEAQKEKLHSQAKILEEANATKDKFFSIIAHDLKNPFNTILGFSDLLMRSYDTLNEEKRKLYIEAINSSTEKTFALLSNLLLWARSQNNRINIIKEELNLAELIETSILPYKSNADQKQIKVINNTTKDWSVNADKYTLLTIIGNLFSNAIKFTENGGSIRLHAMPNGDFIEVKIEDTGIGMPQDVVANLFKINSGYSTEGTNQETGSGLGLILCKEFIEKNNGKIEVESKEGVGSCFTIYIPKK